MKKFLLSVSIAVTSCMAMMSFAPPEEESYLTIWHKDGSKVILNLAEAPKISYVGDRVVIESSTIVEYEFKAIRKMTYGIDNSTGIKLPTTPKEKPFVSEGNTITFLPADEDLHVKIALINGMVFKEFTVKKGEPFSLRLEEAPIHIYIIKVNDVTYKIKLR